MNLGKQNGISDAELKSKVKEEHTIEGLSMAGLIAIAVIVVIIAGIGLYIYL